jgi:hypothetical protein
MTGSSIPDASLPGARYLRLAVIGPRDEWSGALVEAFAATGRDLTQLSPDILTQMRAARPFEIVLLTVHTSDLRTALPLLAEALHGVVVVVCTTSLVRDEDGNFMERVAEGSVTRLVSTLLPYSRVVGAFQQFGPDHLTLARMGAFETGVPVVGDDREACDVVEELIDELRGLESVYAGDLGGTASVEGLAAIVSEASQCLGRPVGFRLSTSGIKILD